jgi:hypothetical protein
MFAMQTSRFYETPVNAGVIQRREHRVSTGDLSLLKNLNLILSPGYCRF